MITRMERRHNGEVQYFRGYGSYLSHPENILRTIGMLRPVRTQHPLIRIGGDNDGGYLVPDDLAGLTACFSPGVSDSSDFEDDLVSRVPMPCYLADGSVEAPALDNPLFHFDKIFIGSDPKPGFIPFNDWVADKVDLDQPGDMLLQMDIEGHEFDAIITADTEIWRRFRVILLELHLVDRVFARGIDQLYAAMFAKLTRHHHVVHLHPNNCCGEVDFNGIVVPRVIEISMIRKDRCTVQPGPVDLPHPLDQDNVPEKPPLTLSDIWTHAPDAASQG